MDHCALIINNNKVQDVTISTLNFISVSTLFYSSFFFPLKVKAKSVKGQADWYGLL